MREVTLANGGGAWVSDDRVSWGDAKSVLRHLKSFTASMCRSVDLSRALPLGMGLTWASGHDGLLDRAAVGVRGLLSEPRVGEFELTEVVVAGIHETRHLLQEREVRRGDGGRLVERLADERMVRWRNPSFWGDVSNYGRWVSEADAECTGIREASGVLCGSGLDGDRMVSDYVSVMARQPYHTVYGLGGMRAGDVIDVAMGRAWDAHYTLGPNHSDDVLGMWLVESDDEMRVRAVCATSGSEQVRLLSDVMCDLCPDRMLSLPGVAARHVGSSASSSQGREAPVWSGASGRRGSEFEPMPL